MDSKTRFTSFRDLQTFVVSEDVRKAAALRKAKGLPAPKLGPKVAR